MRSIKRLGLMLVTVTAICAVAAASASAAPKFLAHPAGGLLASAINNQVFTTAAGVVTCSALKISNGKAALESTTIHVTIEYSTCEAFGLSATVTPVLYLFHADGSVDLLNTVKINGGFGSCIATVLPKNGLKTVKFDNTPPDIRILGKVTGILSFGTGTCSYAHEGNGTYVGDSLVKLHGPGVVRWDP